MRCVAKWDGRRGGQRFARLKACATPTWGHPMNGASWRVADHRRQHDRRLRVAPPVDVEPVRFGFEDQALFAERSRNVEPLREPNDREHDAYSSTAVGAWSIAAANGCARRRRDVAAL